MSATYSANIQLGLGLVLGLELTVRH